MFNTYHAGTHSVSVNAVTGAILKNHPKSWFERFHLKSNRAERLLVEGGDIGFRPNGRGYDRGNPDNAITVLQMVICGDMEVLAECVYTKDYKQREEKTVVGGSDDD